MRFTTVHLERPQGAILQRGIAVQIEHADPADPADPADRGHLAEAGARPIDLFWLYTTQGVPTVPIRRRNLLTDEINTDPETGQLARYRVSGLVETFDHDHQEALCERIIGA